MALADAISSAARASSRSASPTVSAPKAPSWASTASTRVSRAAVAHFGTSTKRVVFPTLKARSSARTLLAELEAQRPPVVVDLQ